MNQAVTENKEQKMHGLAYTLYTNQRYRDADALYRLLATMQPTKSVYWKGLAACLQMKKNYQEALTCYAHSQSLANPPDIYTEVHMADCHFALRQVDQGLDILKLVGKKAKKMTDKSLLSHVAFMKERWKKGGVCLA